MKLSISLLVLEIIGIKVVIPSPLAEDTLILTQVIFRHGDRTPISTLFDYPGLVFANDTFPPYGIGQLTMKGKINSYKLGTELSDRYRIFLGNSFQPNKIQAISSEFGRTMTSLQIVLSALFKPTVENQLIPGLDWQPIVQKYISEQHDRMLSIKCPELYNVQTDQNRGTDLVYKFLTLNLGTEVNNLYTALEVQNRLQVLEEIGYKLPKWLKSVWPEPLTTVGLKFWKAMVEQKLPLVAGYLLQEINGNMFDKINGGEYKIHLYSGHEINIVALLGAFGIYNGSYISYCSYFLIELHKLHGIYGVKVFYRNYKTLDSYPIPIPLCGEFCPLQQFFDITKVNYPRDAWC